MLPLGLLPGLALLEGIRHSDSLVELGASLQIRARGSRVLLGGSLFGSCSAGETSSLPWDRKTFVLVPNRISLFLWNKSNKRVKPDYRVHSEPLPMIEITVVFACDAPRGSRESSESRCG